MINVMHLTLCGALLLTGCPGSGDSAGGGLVAGSVTLVIPPAEVEEGANVCYSPVNEGAVVAEMLELVNQERAQRGLHALTLNPVLTEMAEDYCCEMIEGGFFTHINPATGEGPGHRAIEAGYVFLAIGENLAAGQTSPEWAMTEWMDSTLGHRENILAAQWREIGIAVRAGGEHGVYWVQEFGNPP